MKKELSNKDIREMRNEQGFEYWQIAALLFTTTAVVKKVYYGHYKKLIVKNCSECGQHFYGTPYSKITICTRSTCKQKLYDKKQEKIPTRTSDMRKMGKIREYSSTSLLLIADDLMHDRSIHWIAQMYDRDEADLEAYIEKVKADGTLEKMQKCLKRMRDDKVPPGRGKGLI